MSKDFKIFLAILFTVIFFVFLFTFTIFPVFEIKPFSFYFIHTYYSSPGYTTAEGLESFEQNKMKCHGISLLLNRRAALADAPGISLCLGTLK